MPDSRLGTFLRFVLTSGRLYGKALRVTALTVIEFSHAPKDSEMF